MGILTAEKNSALAASISTNIETAGGEKKSSFNVVSSMEFLNQVASAKAGLGLRMPCATAFDKNETLVNKEGEAQKKQKQFNAGEASHSKLSVFLFGAQYDRGKARTDLGNMDGFGMEYGKFDHIQRTRIGQQLGTGFLGDNDIDNEIVLNCRGTNGDFRGWEYFMNHQLCVANKVSKLANFGPQPLYKAKLIGMVLEDQILPTVIYGGGNTAMGMPAGFVASGGMPDVLGNNLSLHNTHNIAGEVIYAMRYWRDKAANLKTPDVAPDATLAGRAMTTKQGDDNMTVFKAGCDTVLNYYMAIHEMANEVFKPMDMKLEITKYITEFEHEEGSPYTPNGGWRYKGKPGVEFTKYHVTYQRGADGSLVLFPKRGWKRLFKVVRQNTATNNPQTAAASAISHAISNGGHSAQYEFCSRMYKELHKRFPKELQCKAFVNTEDGKHFDTAVQPSSELRNTALMESFPAKEYVCDVTTTRKEPEIMRVNNHMARLINFGIGQTYGRINYH